jgi:hypothetical protein
MADRVEGRAAGTTGAGSGTAGLTGRLTVVDGGAVLV